MTSTPITPMTAPGPRLPLASAHPADSVDSADLTGATGSADPAPTAAAGLTSGPSVRARLRKALGRHGYAALALPLDLLGLLSAPRGTAHRVERWQRALATRLLEVTTTDRAARRARPPRTDQRAVDAGAPVSASGTTRRVLGPMIVRLPVDLVAFVVVVPMWALFLTRGVAYPVFGADNLDQSWGGPTLAGAWFVHFIQGPPLLLLVTLVLTPLSKLQARLAKRHLPSSRPG